MSAVIVRYRVKPGRSEENAELVRAVYAELARTGAPGFRYATFLLEDGVTFVHVAFMDEGVEPPLPGLASFQRFTGGLPARCDDPPQVSRSLERIGSFGF